MSVQVELNSDLKEVEPKVIGPFTKKQGKCVLGMVVICIPIFFTLFKVNITLALIMALIPAIPLALIGWVPMRGLPFEIFIIRWYYFKFGAPKRRVYKGNTYINEILKEAEKIEEQEKISKMSKRQLKRYEKEKAALKHCKASKNPDYKLYK